MQMDPENYFQVTKLMSKAKTIENPYLYYLNYLLDKSIR